MAFLERVVLVAQVPIDRGHLVRDHGLRLRVAVSILGAKDFRAEACNVEAGRPHGHHLDGATR